MVKTNEHKHISILGARIWSHKIDINTLERSLSDLLFAHWWPFEMVLGLINLARFTYFYGSLYIPDHPGPVILFADPS